MDVRGSPRLWGSILLTAAFVLILALQFLGGERFTWGESRGPTLEHVDVVPWRERKGETAFMSEGDLFQVEGCPYTLSRRQAEEALADDSEIGNTITLMTHGGGRAGNHFMTLSAYLSMGYCCRTRLLTLPAADDTLPHEGEHFGAEHRWFDFSDVNLPWSVFQNMRDDPEICRPETKDGGSSAFGYVDVHWKLLQCMNRVYLRGCEKAYLGGLVDTGAYCKKPPAKKKGDGSLVIHIRSGDIFNPRGEGGKRPGFGQPPLQYYLRVLAAKNWDDVTILTASWQEGFVNPVYTVLDMMAETGTLGESVRLYKNRSLLQDVRSMLCADALASSRSSLSFLTFAHSRASTFYLPSPCGKGSYRRMKNPPVKASFDNATLLILEKPDAEVFGIDWRDNGGVDYSVYQDWRDNAEQLLEMTTYRGIAGIRKCSASS